MDAIEMFEHARNLEDALDDRGRAEHEVERRIPFARCFPRVDERLDRRGVDEFRRAEVDDQMRASRQCLAQGVLKLSGAAEIVLAAENDLGHARLGAADFGGRFVPGVGCVHRFSWIGDADQFASAFSRLTSRPPRWLDVLDRNCHHRPPRSQMGPVGLALAGCHVTRPGS